jgi:hypothetical protein
VTAHPTAVVVGLHVWPAEAAVPVAVDPLVLDWGGPVGDRHHGLTMRSDVRQKSHYERGTEIRNPRQVSIVERSELDDVAEALGVTGLAPGLIADNIYLSGAADLTTLPRMTRLVFAGGAVLMLGGENDPCTIAGAMVEAVHGTPATRFPKAAIHKRGVTGWVEHPGEVRVGESVEIRV